MACGILFFAEIKEASIFNADRETVNLIEDTVDETQRTVNLIEDTAGETQETVNSVEDTVDETQRTVNLIEDTAGETQETVNSVETKVDNIGRQVSGLGEKIDSLPSTLATEIQDSSSQEAHKTQEAVNSVETKVDNIGRQVSDLDEKIDNLPATLTSKSQENAVPSKFHVTMVLIACSVFIFMVIGVSMFHSFSSKANSILQENSTNVAGILNQVSDLDTKITKIDSLQKHTQEQIQGQIQREIQREMKNLLDQIQNLSKKIDSRQSTPTPSDQDSSSTGLGDSPSK